MKISFGGNEDRTAINYAVQSKDDRQEVSVLKWRDAKGIGTLNIVPRFGKTRLGLKIIERVLQKNTLRVIIVVPNKQVEIQWLVELDVYNKLYGKIDTSAVYIFTRSIFNKAEITEGSFVIYDEIHKYITTEKTLNKMLNAKAKFVLGLTGTLPEDAEDIKLIESIAPVVDSIDEKEALSNKWINPYEEYNVVLPFPPPAMYDYVKYSNHIAETLQLFKGAAKLINGIDLYDNIYFGYLSDYDVIVSCLSGKMDKVNKKYITGKEIRYIVGSCFGWNKQLNLHNDYDRQLDNNWSPDKILLRVRTFINFIKDRNYVITDAQEKLDYTLKLLKQTKHIETLIYTGSIDFAEDLCERINNSYGSEIAITFHSKVPSKPLIDFETGDYFRYKSGDKKGKVKIFGKKLLKKHYIECVKQGKYKILITVESLNEGLNIPNLKQVIALSGTRNQITYKQRSARVKTIDEQDLSKVGRIFNVYFDNFYYKGNTVVSIDFKKLGIRQKGLNKTPTYITSQKLLEIL